MALVLRLRMTADVLSVNGGIHGLRLASCVFGRDDTKQNVSVMMRFWLCVEVSPG